MKVMKKSVAILVAVLLLFSSLPLAFAAESEKCPTIYIPGILTSDIYADVNDEETRMDFPSQEQLIEVVKNELIPALIVYAADRDVDKLAAVVSREVNDIFEDAFYNPDGTAKGNSGAITYYPAPGSISAGSILKFEWDWREDPFKAAAELDAFVNYVIASTGCNKVALTSHSLGSVVILTYLTVYGNDKVSGIVYDTPVIDGVNYIGKLLCGDIKIDGDALIYSVYGLLGAFEDMDAVESALDIFKLAGITDELAGVLDSALDAIAPVIYRDTLVPLFAPWLTIWAMTSEEDVDRAIEHIFSEYMTDEASLVLRGKIEKYNSLVRENRYQTLLDFDAEGKMAVISRYGYSSLPITVDWSEMGDTVVETKSSSLGATTAPIGDIFDDAYLEGKDSTYISPDKTVDASTCLFPEKTWFIKNINHAEADETMTLYSSLLFSQQEMTCDNYKLSRFTLFNAADESFIEDNTLPQKEEEKSPLRILFEFISMLLKRIFAFFTK